MRIRVPVKRSALDAIEHIRGGNSLNCPVFNGQLMILFSDVF